MNSYREKLKNKKRIVIKIGSSSLTYPESGYINISKIEKLVRTLADIRNSGIDVVLVSSGAIAIGKNKLNLCKNELTVAQKQAVASIGQAQLMTLYQKLFSEYNNIAAQILITKFTMVNDRSRKNARNTFEELFKLKAIPVVNENDTVSTQEIEFGDNDSLSAVVAALVNADLLILLSDIDGLFTDDPNQNPQAEFIDLVPEITDDLILMGKSSSGSSIGTGGMATKLSAAKIATASGADMVIANGKSVSSIEKIICGENIGTLFLSDKKDDFKIKNYINNEQEGL